MMCATFLAVFDIGFCVAQLIMLRVADWRLVRLPDFFPGDFPGGSWRGSMTSQLRPPGKGIGSNPVELKFDRALRFSDL